MRFEEEGGSNERSSSRTYTLMVAPILDIETQSISLETII
jgi:hypothetical protein